MNRQQIEKMVTDLKNEVLDAQKSATSAEFRILFQFVFVIATLVDELVGQIQSLGGFAGVGTGPIDDDEVTEVPTAKPPVATEEPAVKS